MRTRRAIAMTGAAATLLAGVVIPATGAGAKPAPEQLLTDLSSPKGVDIGAAGPVVSQGAFGAPGPVLEYVTKGKHKGTANERIGFAPARDVAVVDGDETWVLMPLGPEEDAHVGAVHLSPGGMVVADITAYQETDPDPFDLEDLPTESNPYGITALPGGDALVVDAAGNDLLRITPAGEISTVAVFTPEITSTDHLPPGFFDDPETPEVEEGPPAMPAEAVPTTVTVGPDGHAYVGQLNGFPFRPGNAKIWKVDPTSTGATCAADGDLPGCSTAQSGFSAIQDIDFAPNGKLYVLELAEGGVFAFEGGFETGDFPPAPLLEVKKNGQRKQLAAGQIFQPGGVAAENDAVYVTDGLFFGGRLLRIRG